MDKGIGHLRIYHAQPRNVKNSDIGAVLRYALQERFHHLLRPRTIYAPNERHQDYIIGNWNKWRGKLTQGRSLRINDLLLKQRSLRLGLAEFQNVPHNGWPEPATCLTRW